MRNMLIVLILNHSDALLARLKTRMLNIILTNARYPTKECL